MAQIKKDTSLRKAILQAAITGQLISDIGGESLPLAAAGKPSSATPSAGTPHNAPTETGKQLLDRIIEERNKKLLAEWEEALKKNVGGKATSPSFASKTRTKKPVPIVASEIDEDEIPFEIPENWCWCRLFDICNQIVDCPHSTPKYMETESEYCAIDTNCINEFGEITKLRFLNEKEYHERIKRLIPEKNDIIYTREGSICRAAILQSRNVCLGQRVMLLRPSLGISSRFLQIYLMSPSTINILTQKSVGMGVQHINVSDVHNLLFPLPPLSVQNAIVAKLEQVLPLVDAYENAVFQKEELKSTLSDKVKKAILQEAITGKLTEQWRKQKAAIEPAETTERGEQLLDRIIKERNAKVLAEWEEKVKTNPKAKKPVPVVASEIGEDEIPFEIPESWCWCRLGDVGDWGAGATPNRSNKEYYSNEGIPWIKTGELNNGIVMTSEEYITEKALKECSLRYNKIGDVMIAMYGATIGKVAIAGIELTTNQACCACTPANGLYNKYLFYFLMANKENFINQGEGGAQPNISREKIIKTLIPLPPLEEQEEIVKKVEELLPLCK